ncbi:hypothetical protein [Roseivivax sediminis]|uniref:Uncharacterized protein n=1 Tax=Roseivivax sediminis TaxID=936889 RepID=A0A1I1UA90_9RHOB|nr:hypothetical protein [Roseivivax sediminis]SFD67781.1 hypothetical protein SAMN04515678_102243 [Roseivivax sediminis]
MTAQETEALQFLIDRARKVGMTEKEVTEQRRSFAYGNSAFENSRITREMIDQEADKLGL